MSNAWAGDHGSGSIGISAMLMSMPGAIAKFW
jgi:hypothetical protein